MKVRNILIICLDVTIPTPNSVGKPLNYVDVSQGTQGQELQLSCIELKLQAPKPGQPQNQGNQLFPMSLWVDVDFQIFLLHLFFCI